MPYGWIDPEVFIEHNGMTVYHVYKDDEISQGCREFWYTTDLCGGDCNDPFAFDVREMCIRDRVCPCRTKGMGYLSSR